MTEEVYGYPGDSNRLQGISVASSPVREFNHDAAGNIIEDDRGGTVYHYRYNDRNRLDQLIVGTTVTTTYAYDGLERMALRTTASPAATTHYVYDAADRLIAEADDTGQTVREYIWFDDLPLAVVADVDTASPHLYYVHADHLNRPVMMTDDSGSTVWEATYWPFGEAYSITGSAANNLRFPGQYFLIESGLAYNWHRHYDATLGRYTQPDPLLYGLADAGGVEPSLLAGMPSASEAGTIAQMMRATPMVGETSSGPNAFDALDKLQIQTPDGRNPLAASSPKGMPSEFKDGPNLCAYGKSSPFMKVDPTGLAASAMSPIPNSLNGATCVDLDCAQVISQCQAQCIGIYSGDIPGTLPGMGHDYPGRLRRCTRECAQRSGCYDY